MKAIYVFCKFQIVLSFPTTTLLKFCPPVHFYLQGRTLRCSLSETKYRLFIGNVPKNLTEDEFKKLIDEVGPGAEHIELIKVRYDFLQMNT